MGNCYPHQQRLELQAIESGSPLQNNSEQPLSYNNQQIEARKRKEEMMEKLRNPGMSNDNLKPDRSFESNSRNRPEFAQEAVRVTCQFWMEHIQSLTDENKTIIAVTLYGHLFSRIPDCRQILLQRGKIEDVGFDLLNSIGRLLAIVSRKNTSKIPMELRKLGTLYRDFGITDKHYHLFLQSLHWTFEESSGGRNVYSLRIKFCLEHIFTISAKLITGKDFTTLFGGRVVDFWSLEFLDSLDICLAHPTGREYFDRYLEQSFCVEYMSFLRKFNAFKGLASHQERYEKALDIFKAHLSLSAQEYIELPNQEHVNQLKKELDNFGKHQKKNNRSNGSENGELDMYPIKSTLLDDIYNDVTKIIEKDIWPQFVAAIHSIKEATRTQVV